MKPYCVYTVYTMDGLVHLQESRSADLLGTFGAKQAYIDETRYSRTVDWQEWTALLSNGNRKREIQLGTEIKM